MSHSEQIQISIQGQGISYKGKVNPSVAGHVLSICLGSNSHADQPSEKGAPIKSTLSIRESAAEYLNRHAPRRNPDKILTLAGYLRDHHNKGFFHPGEVKVLFREAGEPFPANFSRDFFWAVSSGWLAPDETKKGTFFVTNTGSRVLNDGFPKEMVDKTRNRFGGRRKRSHSSK